MNYAPIILFVYQRLSHVEQTIDSLQRNNFASESDLIIYSDGPKNSESEEKVNKVRSFINQIKGFKSVKVIESKRNLGLSESIVKGVTEVLQQYGRAIVLEDDIVVSKQFLRFMNTSLDFYEKDEDVICISGYFYPIKNIPDSVETFFLKGADCWGWATWKRGWNLFEADGKKLLEKIDHTKCKKDLNINNSYDYYKMLKDQVEGINDSWAVKWYVSAFLKEKLTLYPNRSLVKNIGLDGTGTHCSELNRFDTEIDDRTLFLKKSTVEENLLMKKKLEAFFKSFQPSFFQRINHKIANKNGMTIFMKRKIKQFLKEIIPPFILKYRNDKKRINRYEGIFHTWDEALQSSTGYETEIILEKVLDSCLKVKNKEALSERDSVALNEVQFSFPFLTALFYISAIKKRKLNVIDFGGSLGSTYFQVNNYFSKIEIAQWNIIEQQHFVDKGKRFFQNDIVKFHSSIDDCLTFSQQDVFICSSSLQYVEKPYTLLEKIVQSNIEFIIFDRIPFSQQEYITVQKVPPEIYTASYPSWIFKQDKLMNFFFQNRYKLIVDFDSVVDISVFHLNNAIVYKGFFLEKMP